MLWPVMIHSSQLTGKSAPLNPKDINHEHHEFKKDQKTQTKQITTSDHCLLKTFAY